MAEALVLTTLSTNTSRSSDTKIAAGMREAGASRRSAEAARSANHKLGQTAASARINDVADYDAIAVGTGTRFGRVSSPIASFLGQAGGQWAKDALHGKVGGAFVVVGNAVRRP
jgi:NAD(P)H dehydrogenase (quinone)